jgi:hypothetical protein
LLLILTYFLNMDCRSVVPLSAHTFFALPTVLAVPASV